jgi:MFS family permease
MWSPFIGTRSGGEYSAGTPLAFEHCPPRARGLLGGLLLGAYPLAYAFISLVVLAVFALAPAGGATSPYVQWGWRSPSFSAPAWDSPADERQRRGHC